MGEVNCIQQRNPGAGFINEHRTLCAHDRSGGIEHGLASHHLNLGKWCGNICEACATATVGSGPNRRPKYKPDEISEGTYIHVEITSPRLPRPIRPSSNGHNPPTNTTEVATEQTMATRKTTTKSGSKSAAGSTKEITDDQALKLITKSQEKGISQAPSTLARWFRTQGKAMSGNRMVKLLKQAAKA